MSRVPFPTVCRKSLLAVALFATSTALGQDRYFSPAANRSYPTNVFWGDTHLHTNMSVDANGMGNRALSPDDAYRFAKGGTVRAHNGQLVRLRRPLDFIVVTDHAVNLGVLPRLQKLDPLVTNTRVGKKWLAALKRNPLTTGMVLTSESPELRAEAMRQMAVGRGGRETVAESQFAR